MAQVKNGDSITIHYTGKLKDGTVFDSSVEREPFEFTVGAKQVIGGFDKAVLGMEVGDKKTISIPSQEAYGPYEDKLVQEIEREKLPDGLDPQVGQQLESMSQSGSKFVVTVVEVSDSSVTVDANHPLAGKELVFDIELLNIN